MLVRPGSLLTERRDVLFQSDTGYWIAAYSRGVERVSSFTHPLLGVLWVPGPRLLYLLLRRVLPDAEAATVAGRTFTALLAAAGVAALFAAAARRGASGRVLALLLPAYLLFTDQVLVALPEHFALSQALLSIAFALLVVGLRPGTQLASLGVLAAATGGVTVTNAAFPLAAAGLVDRNNDWHLPMVTYQPTYAPYALWPYDRFQSVAAVAWIVLLATSGVRAYRDPTTRPYTGLLLGWIAFNTVLHNVWGDEYFLFSTHWSWALFALVLLAAPHWRWPAVACLTAPLAMGQVHTLFAVHRVLATIV